MRHSYKSWMTALTCSVIALTLAATPTLGGYTIDKHTLDGGGVSNATGGSYTLSATDGQASPGTSTGGTYTLQAGFWSSALPGDCDGDYDIDLTDFENFEACFTGPQAATNPGCDCYDINNDNHIDLFDFMVFTTYFTGP